MVGKAVGRLVVAGCIAVAGLIGLPTSDVAQAATFTVNSTADAADANPGDGQCAAASGACTLRAAIQETNRLSEPDSIVVPAGTYGLTIPGRDEGAAATGDLNIRQDLSITGNGMTNTVIYGNGIDRVFSVGSSASVSITGVTIRNGDAGAGDGGAISNSGVLTLGNVIITANVSGDDGGAINSFGTLTIRHSAIAENRASSNAGGIDSFGTLTIEDSTIAANTAGSDAGGIDTSGTANIVRSTIGGNTAGSTAGGLQASGTTTFINSTISGNTAGSSGGGIYGFDTLILVNTTVANNGAATGGAIYRLSSGSVYLRNSIVATSTRGSNCNRTLTSEGGNLDSGGTCGFTAAGDRQNADPRLAPLTDNGGPTWTHAPLAGSPAIDAATASGCPERDQRGFARPVDGNGDGAPVCDIGAVEVGAAPPRPPASCAPRPRVAVNVTRAAAGQLAVRVVATSGRGAPDNRVHSIQFAVPANAIIDVAGQPSRSGEFAIDFPSLPAEVPFTLRRTAPGPITVRLIVIDDCNEWPTFVGGGESAF